LTTVLQFPWSQSGREAQVVLTDHEARVLLATADTAESALYEIAGAARLTLSEVAAAASKLVDRKFAQTVGEGRLRLTPEGEQVRGALAQQRTKQMAQSPSWQQIIVVPEDTSHAEFVGLDSAALDAALDEAIEKA
jgi:hypothetical protein